MTKYEFQHLIKQLRAKYGIVKNMKIKARNATIFVICNNNVVEKPENLTTNGGLLLLKNETKIES